MKLIESTGRHIANTSGCSEKDEYEVWTFEVAGRMNRRAARSN